MSFTIITGMSGAGKTVALKTLEDMGYYCVDNLPVYLMTQFAELIIKNEKGRDFAAGVDIRSGTDLTDLKDVFSELSKKGIRYRILFLEASDQVLIKRYKETRRSHPLRPKGRLEDGISAEREALSWLKKEADAVIDTSNLLTQELRNRIGELFSRGRTAFQNIVITVMSFGYKYGLPEDADLIFDVRFLPNPFYVEELKHKNGLSEDVQQYVLKDRDGEIFLEKLTDLLDFLLPRYIQEGKTQLVIAFGCTGGKHRSVTVAEKIRGYLEKKEEVMVNSIHRDAEKSSSSVTLS